MHGPRPSPWIANFSHRAGKLSKYSCATPSATWNEVGLGVHPCDTHVIGSSDRGRERRDRTTPCERRVKHGDSLPETLTVFTSKTSHMTHRRFDGTHGGVLDARSVVCSTKHTPLRPTRHSTREPQQTRTTSTTTHITRNIPKQHQRLNE